MMLQRKIDETRQYRQGDVMLVACDGVPPGAREQSPDEGRIVLAYGEVSGHAHALDADRVRYFREDGTGQAFLHVPGTSPAELTHEEHAPLSVAPGTYRVVRQREFMPSDTPRLIAD